MQRFYPYSGRRSVTRSGNSFVISLPQEEIVDEFGVDLDELADSETQKLRAKLTEEGEFIVDIES